MSRKLSQKLIDYIDIHKRCEACSCPVNESTMPHHIKTRATGGGDDWGNLLRLCYEHHMEIHTIGPVRFIEKFPHLSNKIRAIKYKI